jgi:excisionase family DNA binding protein
MPATTSCETVSNSDQPRDGFATIPQAARFLQVGRSSIYAMMNAGTLPAKRLPGLRAVRIPWSVLRSLVADTN